MSDPREEIELLTLPEHISAVCDQVWLDSDSMTGDIIATLTPGSRWTLPDGTAMVAVPVNPTDRMLEDVGSVRGFDVDEPNADQCHRDWWGAMIAAASEPGASAQASDEARDNGRIGDAEAEDDELAQDSERGE